MQCCCQSSKSEEVVSKGHGSLHCSSSTPEPPKVSSKAAKIQIQMCTAWSSHQVRASKDSEVNCQTFWKQCLVNSKRSQALRSFQFIPYTIVLPRLLDCKWAIFLGQLHLVCTGKVSSTAFQTFCKLAMVTHYFMAFRIVATKCTHPNANPVDLVPRRALNETIYGKPTT